MEFIAKVQANGKAYVKIENPKTDWDEFLPIVRFKKPLKHKVEGEELVETDDEVTLSKQLDKDKSTFKIWQLSTEKRKLKSPFIPIKFQNAR